MNGSTMDFFDHQEKARKKTGMLVFLFLIAVILIIVCVYLAVTAAIFFLSNKKGMPTIAFNPYDPLMFAYIAGATILLVSLGSFYKMAQLGKGGEKVAELLGGQKVHPNTTDPDERKLLNVVEEMAIASGITVPQVYIMPNEHNINAFAAGFSPSSAVIGVTDGAIRTLSRDELQGVIAHEFSHIINGDMRLNIRLIGVLHGILLIGITGSVLMRIMFYSGAGHRRRRSRSGKNDSGGAALVMMALGVALMVIGFIGVFFGKLIKAAVSRQREFLADSSAVQFTRNPDGLSGALKKIGGLSGGSKLSTSHAEEASHLFFGNALSINFLSGLLSTHPDLSKRIKAINPGWDGKYPVVDQSLTKRPAKYKVHKKYTTPITTKGKGMIPGMPGLPGMPGIPGMPGGQVSGFAAGAGTVSSIPFMPHKIMQQIGTISPAQIIHAAALISAIPQDIRQLLRETEGAKAVIYSILINKETEYRQKQWDYIEKAEGKDMHRILNSLLPKTESLGPDKRIALTDLAIPALRGLQKDNGLAFLKNVQELIMADDKVTLFEYALGKILRKNLEPIYSGRVDRAKIHYYSINGLTDEISILLSALAHSGNEEEAMKQQAFAAGVVKMRVPPQKIKLLNINECGFDKMDIALDHIKKSVPAIKRRVMEGMAWCAAIDKTITLEEAEMIRAIADAIDCPVPPMISQKSGKNRF
jgi:Zn-dependent protease with chaperone function